MTIEDYPKLDIKRVTLTGDLVWPNGDGTSCTYSSADCLDRKVADEPVLSGAKRIGFLLWKVRGFKSDSEIPYTVKPKITITAKDINGVVIRSTDKAETPTNTIVHYPGMQVPKINRTH